MSELKEHLFVPYSELQEGDELTDAITIAKSYYLKYEADMEIRHNKYKRCLAMARMCEEKSDRYEALQDGDDFFDWGREIEFYYKWYKRWLKIAEKFKPNSTAQ